MDATQESAVASACESVADGSGGVWVVGDEAVRKNRNRLASESVA